jgi:peptidoglycan/xylan/chitin deacetylase (PgdA/CDA1 family)
MTSRKAPTRRHRGAQQPRLRLTPARCAAAGSLLAAVVVAAAVVFTSVGGSRRHASSAASKHAKLSGRHGVSGAPAARTPTKATVPILAYHVINQSPAQSAISSSLYVPATEFSAQMQALKADGWHAVTLNQLKANWTRGTPLGPGKPIVITFDEGYASHYTNALPTLKRLGWAGVENLQVNGLPPSDGGLADSQIRGLIAAGWELDSDAIGQSDLTTLDALTLSEQITTARHTLRSRYNVPVNWLCYPQGHYNATVIAAARAAGFLGASTTHAGWATPETNPFLLPRVSVIAGTSPSELLSQIKSAKQTASAPPAFTGT